jgi:hypothetical protein
VCRGLEALRRHVEGYRHAWADSAVDLDEIGSVGDRGLARIRYDEFGHQSGMRLVDNSVNAIHDLRRGRIVRVRQFVNDAEARAAVGLSE